MVTVASFGRTIRAINGVHPISGLPGDNANHSELRNLGGATGGDTGGRPNSRRFIEQGAMFDNRLLASFPDDRRTCHSAYAAHWYLLHLSMSQVRASSLSISPPEERRGNQPC